MRFSPLLKRRKFRAASLAAILLLAAALVGIMFVRGSAAAPQYRTAAATLGTVRQTLSLTGNLTPVAQSNLNFQVGGMVTAIDVTVGQTVTAGQVLATVDPASLQATLTEAQANFVAAQAKQAADQSTSSSSNAAQQLATAKTSLSNDITAYNDTVAVYNQTIKGDQHAISSDQASVNADAQAVATAQGRYNGDGCSSSSSSATCQSDQQNLSAAQQQQSKDQQSLTAAQAALPTDQVRGRQSNDQAAARVAADRTAVSNAAAGTSTNSSAATAAQDAAGVTQAQQAVTTAQTALTNATLTAPNSGQVAQINTAVGNTVSSPGGATGSNSSSSSAAQFIILSPGSFQVTSTVSDSVVSEVAIGQRAVVTAAGSTNGLAANVTSVGEIATVTSGVATFPVTVQITGSHPALRDGMSATVTVVINEVVGVLTVPTSAVHTNGTASTVEVLKNGVPSTVVVTVGAADPSRTQIVSGLSQGDTVVIATVTSTVPSAASGSGTPRRAGGAGGFAGAGGGGGGAIAVPGG